MHKYQIITAIISAITAEKQRKLWQDMRGVSRNQTQTVATIQRRGWRFRERRKTVRVWRWQPRRGHSEPRRHLLARDRRTRARLPFRFTRRFEEGHRTWFLRNYGGNRRFWECTRSFRMCARAPFPHLCDWFLFVSDGCAFVFVQWWLDFRWEENVFPSNAFQA